MEVNGGAAPCDKIGRGAAAGKSGGHLWFRHSPYLSDGHLSFSDYTWTWNSSFTRNEQDDWHYVLERMKDRRITPEELISHRFPLEELTKGFELMRDKREEYGKVMGIM
mgnify:CR=1 FL=1